MKIKKLLRKTIFTVISLSVLTGCAARKNTAGPENSQKTAGVTAGTQSETAGNEDASLETGSTKKPQPGSASSTDDSCKQPDAASSTNENMEPSDFASGTNEDTDLNPHAAPGSQHEPEQSGQASPANPESLICAQGMTLAERFAAPEGYQRTEAKKGSFCEFLRGYPMKEDGSPVLLYDGSKKSRQDSHAAVFALPIEHEDLQQCADSVMRIYAEYFRATNQYDRIAFHFVNGFCAEYTKWRDGYRIQVNGNDTAWAKTASFDDSYENFQKYLRIVFSYAGTLSMEAESEQISLSEIQAGDVFLKGASPGHVVMLADLCENTQGKKAFLLAQGYMPAQEFHILKNPLHENDPWYYMEEVQYPFRTPEYTFMEGSLRRLNY